MPEATDADISPRNELNELSEQAAEWVVCLSGDQVSQKQRADFEAWLTQDPRHRETYKQVDTLWHSVSSRKQPSLAGIKAFLGVILLFGCFYGLPLSTWLADERTSAGEIRRITLADGSHITLDSGSAADIAFDTQQRRIILHRGRVLAEVAPTHPATSGLSSLRTGMELHKH